MSARSYWILILSVYIFSSCSSRSQDPLWLLALTSNPGKTHSAEESIDSPINTETETGDNETGETEGEVAASTENPEEPSDEDGADNSGEHDQTPGDESSDEADSETEETTSPEETVVEIIASDDEPARTEDEFAFNTTGEFGLELSFVSEGTGVKSVLVQIIDTNSVETDSILFQASSDASGLVAGSFTIESAKEEVVLKCYIKDQVLEQTISLKGISKIHREYEISFGTTPDPKELPSDSDGDGIRDTYDQFPDDPALASVVVTPTHEEGIVAYEDLYPARGDADFNDYVVSFRLKEYLNAAGKVVKIEGYFKHLARGAGYKHRLFLNLPETVAIASGSVTRFDFEGLPESSHDIVSSIGMEILPDSSTTLDGGMIYSGDTYLRGKTAHLVLQFAVPVERSVLGKAPYDLYIQVINTGAEIHLTGFFEDETGKDRFIDSAGFPWAIMIPHSWNWPYESRPVGDTDTKTGCYPEFADWYTSAGEDFQDWFLESVEGCVYPYSEVKPGDAEDLIYPNNT